MLVIYLFISPLCGVAQTPDCGMLVVYLSSISPFCGVAQTPDCGIVKFLATFRGVILDTRSVHFFYLRIACPYFLYMRASQILVYFMTDLSS